MGMDIHGKTASVRMNWTLWAEMRKILQANGFKGRLPSGNDGDTVDLKTAREVGRAVLRWWAKKDEASGRELPQLNPWESTILAYALLLLVDEGKATHD